MNQDIWSIGLGTLAGIRLRVHMFLLLFATLTLYLCRSPEAEHLRAAESILSNTWIGVVGLCVLLVSVVLHELAHATVTLRLGGDVEEIVLWPLGGLGRTVRMPDPQAELVAASAGPMANLGICLLAAIALAAQGETDVASLMIPFQPNQIASGSSFLVVLKMAFWINWVLVLINAIAAFPFDGQRIVQSTIQTGWPHLDEDFAYSFTTRLGRVLGACLFVAGLFWFFAEPQNSTSIVPVWGPMMLLGIFVFFSARKDDFQHRVRNETDELFLGYDFSEGYTSLERSQVVTTHVDEPSTLASWIQKRREQQEERQREIEADEDGRVDEILTRVHENGFESLSADDRALLNRVSKRYQKRMTQ
ncbi:MAG: M50 family metallopeptidase [Planctomycetales bacterium]|nr:M50 family metallopeptidase [Planctomycetales bacterium]